jgi:hypothetical protein
MIRNDSFTSTASSKSSFDSDPVPGLPPAPEEKEMEVEGEMRPLPLCLALACPPSVMGPSEGHPQDVEVQLSLVPEMNHDILGVFDREEEGEERREAGREGMEEEENWMEYFFELEGDRGKQTT